MSKFTPATLANLDNPGSAVATINANFTELQTLLDLMVSRNGTSPNTMTADFDMNSHRILNLPVPVAYSEPARHGDIQTYVDQAAASAAAALVSKNAAVVAEVAAELAETNTQALYTSFLQHYLGAYASDPAGWDWTVGALYFNTTTDNWKVFAIDDVHSVGDAVVDGGTLAIVGYWLPFPQASLRSLSDVDANAITNNQVLKWSTDKFVPYSMVAVDVGYTDTYTIGATTVQAAIDYVVAHTSDVLFDISFFAQSTSNDGETVAKMVMARPVTFKTAGNYRAHAGTAATASTVYILKKNGTQFGTATFGIAGTTATFSVPGDTSFAAGDYFTLIAPATADATLADISFTMSVYP